MSIGFFGGNMKQKFDDVALVLSAGGSAHIDKMIGRKKERRDRLRRLMDSADIHVLDPASGATLYRWKHLFWRKGATAEVEEFLDILGHLEAKELFFVRLGHALDDIEVWGGYTKNPFKVAVVRDINLTV